MAFTLRNPKEPTSFASRAGSHREQFANPCDAGIMCAHATLAQSAEQTLRKRQVLGSIPKGGSPAPESTGPFL